PGNDDAIRSSALLTRVIADAVAEGLMARAGLAANAGRDDKPEPGMLATDEPLADWETELLKPTEVATAPAETAATETPTETAATETPTETAATETPTETAATEAETAQAPEAGS